MEISINKMVYKSNVVFDSTSLSLSQNKAYALVGKNGSGKTTLFRLISKSIINFDGKIDLEGKKVASLIDKANPFENETCASFASSFLTKEEMNTFEGYKNLFEIDEYFDKKINKCSLGMRRKYLIALILSKDCGIILLDEPFNGLDTISTNKLIELINKIKMEKIIIVSSHDFSNIHLYADELILIEDKKLINKPLLSSIYKVEFSSTEERDRFIENTRFKVSLRNGLVLVNIEGSDKKELLKELSEYNYESFQKEDFNYDK